jgi:hypothetical protein
MHRNWMLIAAAGLAFLGAAPPHVRQTQQPPEPTQVIQLSTKLSAEIPAAFRSLQSDETPPPGALAPYAPPFHFSQVLMLASAVQNSVLLLGLSDNPLVGHDGYWLDAQMHASSGSGMSMLDLLFYFFFPPSHDCMEDALQNYTTATMTADAPDSTPLIQVSYKCPHPDTLSGFYSAQVSTGITFQQTNAGPRAYGEIRDFYVAPMEQADISGMTFFIFEAQRQGQIGAGAIGHYHLPANLQGGKADFFWAIGAPSPFPFVGDVGRSNVPILHVAYATASIAANNKPDFIKLLHGIHLK